MEPPAFRGLPLCATGQSWDVPADFDRELSTAFPAIDRQQTYAEIRVWLVANPANRKTARGMARFINAWFARKQNRGAPATVPIQRESFAESDRRKREERRADAALESLQDNLPSFLRKANP